MQGDLERARALIKAKRYTEARQILHTLPHDETAQRWLAKLDGLMPVERPTLSRRVPLIAFGILVVLLWLVVGVLIGRFAMPASVETVVQIVTATAAPVTQTPIVMPTLPPENALIPTLAVLDSTDAPRYAGGWMYTEEVNDFDGSRYAAAVLPGNVLEGWLGEAQPSLALACVEDYFMVALQLAGGFERDDYLSATYPLRVRFNEGSVETIQGSISDEGNIVTFPGDIGLARQLLTHQRLRVEMKPFQGYTQTVDFDLRGLSAYIEQFEQFCNRKITY